MADHKNHKSLQVFTLGSANLVAVFIGVVATSWISIRTLLEENKQA